ncbi:TPA: hypothetical protein MH287_23415 [Klebsiella pneumoniae]|jgi:hypothetical protein|nr:hypothetical protein [Klebsiella pneumoniae]HBX4670864.1 hypothetical protein [Klebsiella pneumoniae]
MSDKDIKESVYKASEYFKTDKFIIMYNESLHLLNEKSFKNRRTANRDVSTWISALLKKDKK